MLSMSLRYTDLGVGHQTARWSNAPCSNDDVMDKDNDGDEDHEECEGKEALHMDEGAGNVSDASDAEDDYNHDEVETLEFEEHNM